MIIYLPLLLIETTNQDWWFVRKHLTEEKGWVPAQYLMDETNYTLYLQKKLNEKIDKLPVFESKIYVKCLKFNLYTYHYTNVIDFLSVRTRI